MNIPSDGFVDLHSHYVPAVDDGVNTLEEGVALCEGLRDAGFSMVVATPHIRSVMFPNERAGLEKAHADFCTATAERSGMPVLGLGAEHFFDDVVFGLFRDGNALPYPGGHAALVELPPEAIPRGLERCFFDMKVRGMQPVLAHPERYRPLFKRTDPLDALVDAGALPLLDIMSLVGRYGRRPKGAAERMLKEDVYYAACSDAHRPSDVALVRQAIKRLGELVGDERTQELLAQNPRKILDGTAQY
ncbi:MAG: protein-tyrosine phosphatase [Polyangiales bacterium]|jgi:protein-tyrosine phosphatase